MKEKTIGLYQCPDCKKVFVSYKIEAHVCCPDCYETVDFPDANKICDIPDLN